MVTIAASNKIAGLTEGQTLTVNSQDGVLAGDTDSFGYPLSVTRVSTTATSVAVSGGSVSIQGIYGILDMHADGSYSYAALNNIALPADGIVQDKFTFSVTDGHGNTAQASLTITVTQIGVQYVAAAAGQTITIGNGPTVVDASLGGVTVIGGNGNDVVLGGTNDTITLGNGNDWVLGGTSEK
jgi:VCBS repeat-containing protein